MEVTGPLVPVMMQLVSARLVWVVSYFEGTAKFGRK
jgi:hypothetical protein